MANLKDYYENEMGWSAGPHAFVDGVSIWIMTDFNVSGVHSPSWNGTRLGIEMVGDYDTESDEEGMGKKVMDLTIALFGECHSFYGWEPSNNSIKLHKEDPATDHDCPGANVIKSEFVADVTKYMGDGGDHNPNPPEPAQEVEGVVYNIAPNDYLNIRASPSTSAAVIGKAYNDDIVTVVDDAYNGSTRWFRIRFGEEEGADVAVFGWASAAYIKRTGETPPSDTWREDITATEFGGAGDAMESAYGGMVKPNQPGYALPYKWRDEPPPILIIEGPRGQQEVPAQDVGPWNIDDPNYIFNGRRPMSEQQYEQQTPAQNGQVPTNDAGIDLTPNTADAVGISGKGKVRWRFKETRA